jgi:hypothetical protein
VYDVPDWMIAGWPTEDELGVEDDQPVTSTRHREQASLLVHLLKRIWWDRPAMKISRKCLFSSLVVKRQLHDC